MKNIAPPRRAGPYPDREIDCQQAIEAGFQRLVETARAAGWGPAEVTEALEHLALADRLTRNTNSAIAGYRLLDDLIAARQGHA